MEYHKGWIENLKNEERTMKESINNCINKGLTKNAVRAKQILEFSFPDDGENLEPVMSKEVWKHGMSINEDLKHRFADWSPLGKRS